MAEVLARAPELPFKSLIREDFPSGPVTKTLSPQGRGPGFHPWSGNWFPHAATKSSQVCNLRPSTAKEINVNKIKPVLCRTREGLSEQPVTCGPIYTICLPNPSSCRGPFHVGIISEAQSSCRVFAPSRLVMTQLQFQRPSTSQPFQDLVWACPASLPSPGHCGC